MHRTIPGQSVVLQSIAGGGALRFMVPPHWLWACSSQAYRMLFCFVDDYIIGMILVKSLWSFGTVNGSLNRFWCRRMLRLHVPRSQKCPAFSSFCIEAAIKEAIGFCSPAESHPSFNLCKQLAKHLEFGLWPGHSSWLGAVGLELAWVWEVAGFWLVTVESLLFFSSLFLLSWLGSSLPVASPGLSQIINTRWYNSPGCNSLQGMNESAIPFSYTCSSILKICSFCMYCMASIERRVQLWVRSS